MHPHDQEELEFQELYQGRSMRSVYSEFAGIERRAQMADEQEAERGRISAAVASGQFVVVARVGRFGPYDELLFHSSHFVAGYASREEAEAAIAAIGIDDFEYYHEVVGPKAAADGSAAPSAPSTSPRMPAHREGHAIDAIDSGVPF